MIRGDALPESKKPTPCREAGLFFCTAAKRAGAKLENEPETLPAQKTRNIKLLTHRLAGDFFQPLFRANTLLRDGMGISDLQFDILQDMRHYVAHLPHRKRRAAFLELARNVATDFLDTAETYDIGDEDPSSSSESEASGSEEPARPSPSKLRKIS